MSFSTFFFFRQITLLTFFDYFILFFVDLHRKTSPTGLKRLNAAVESSQRAGKFFLPFFYFHRDEWPKVFFFIVSKRRENLD